MSKMMTEAEWNKKMQGDAVLEKGDAFLWSLVRFCDGNPDKVVEGASVWLAGVKAAAMVIKQKYPKKSKKKH